MNQPGKLSLHLPGFIIPESPLPLTMHPTDPSLHAALLGTPNVW